ncbi:ion transport peptide-like [Oppia nitens]|uniref:ion transport peptide-like n=1 Tax=Oppia nitens TaxID=1686743 RepID=UPI0023D9B0F1|nr:ion transport peptide-like [Oppia nitens]
MINIKMMSVLFLLLTIISISSSVAECRDLHKRTFAGLGCLGIYDKAKFARLDRVCEECYQLYREPDLHTSCRQDCFRNEVFGRCVDSLLLSHEQKKLEEMVEDLYGK